MIAHAHKASLFLRDNIRANWQDKVLWMVREKRDKAVQQVRDWEQLRGQASQIKDNVLSELDDYLLEFEGNAINNGAKVHWASDSSEFNNIILEIAKNSNSSKIVKSKSMLTEECGLNPFLKENGFEVTDTDLGERIIQLRNEPPSHIVLPAIHLNKEEVSDLFYDRLGTQKGNSDPKYLTKAARIHLRQSFYEAGVAITGVNFAVAENGAIVVCTNEGNADMGIHNAPIQIHCMGIEKIIPKMEDLAVFTRILARSATGQPITTYTSHYRNPKPDGEMHIVIVDNGRSEVLGSPGHRNLLKCIRCGACMNTCPVFRRSGGHSYGSTIPGPIGSILSPANNMNRHKDLPFASSLCGSCANVCPVKIDIHKQLYGWRQEIMEKKSGAAAKKCIASIASNILAHNFSFSFSGKVARWSIRHLPRFLIYNRMNVWGRGRELPTPPKESFKGWFKRNYPKNISHGQRSNN